MSVSIRALSLAVVNAWFHFIKRYVKTLQKDLCCDLCYSIYRYQSSKMEQLERVLKFADYTKKNTDTSCTILQQLIEAIKRQLKSDADQQTRIIAMRNVKCWF